MAGVQGMAAVSGLPVRRRFTHESRAGVTAVLVASDGLTSTTGGREPLKILCWRRSTPRRATSRTCPWADVGLCTPWPKHANILTATLIDRADYETGGLVVTRLSSAQSTPPCGDPARLPTDDQSRHVNASGPDPGTARAAAAWTSLISESIRESPARRDLVKYPPRPDSGFAVSGRDEFSRYWAAPVASIFRETDIRGKVSNPSEISPSVANRIGRAFGSICREAGQNEIVVGHDAREYSEDLALTFIAGLLSTGMSVFDLGLATTPLVYFAQHHLGGIAGTSVTASHNPNGWAGLKMSILPSVTLLGDQVREVQSRVARNDYVTGRGTYASVQVLDDYLNRVLSGLRPTAGRHVLVDGGNSVSGPIGRLALQKAGHKVTSLNDKLDWDFPNHEPDPERLDARRQASAGVINAKADIGLSFDGDGDRLGVTDENGGTIWSDQVLAILARDVLTRHPGSPIVYDVKCSRIVPEIVLRHGGTPVMCKTGHSHIKAMMRKTAAPFAGERSGHFFNAGDYLGYDDGCHAGLWLTKLVGDAGISISEMINSLPKYVSTPTMQAACTSDSTKQGSIGRFHSYASTIGARELITLDGVRAEFEEGWILVRASSNMPSLVLVAEAESNEALERLYRLMRDGLAGDTNVSTEWENDPWTTETNE